MKRFDELTDEYITRLRAQHYAAQTIDLRERQLRAFGDRLREQGVRDIDDITVDQVRQYIIHLQETPIRRGAGSKDGRRRSANYIRAVVFKLATFFRYLSNHNRILTDPTLKLEPPRRELRLPRNIMTEAEMIRLLNAPAATGNGIRDRAMLELGYSSGLRRQEVVNLDAGDIDLRQGRALIRQGKPRKDRVVPVGKTACAWIGRYLDEVRPFQLTDSRVKALFISYRGERLTGYTVSEIFRQQVRRARIERKVSWHTMRHTCATHLLQAGADIRYIQELLGHASVTTTAIYTRVMPLELKKEVAAVRRKKTPRKD